ncbi:MAG: type IV toxin-antitoxin system AbiEi family antitoxin [Gammaproteobacteria bacterium]|nr:type IV toxin-antitoxin system AbiEi family antitoxin [Gammaproteobacteria bacterium]
MERAARHSLIKSLQTGLPRGAPFDLSALDRLGISAKQAARYAETGWLVRLGQGIYAFPGDTLNQHATVKFLQTRVPGLHVAGKSALGLQGVRHNLAPREPLVLWGDARFPLPAWFTERFPARYVWARLFDWPDDRLATKSLTTPPGTAAGLRVSVPERAVLELLYDVGTHENLEEAHNLFDGLRNFRQDMLGQLLTCCTSVKAVRLFLTWGRETKLVDVDVLARKYRLPVGSEKRWMNRLKDGTLLTLKPLG